MSSSATISKVKKAALEAAGFLGNANDVYADLEDGSDLPQAFHEVAKVLPLAHETLKEIKQQVSKRKSVPENEANKSAEKKEKDAADKAHTRAKRLYDIFDAVVPPGDGPRTARYRSAAGNGGRVELLMKEILEATIALAEPLAFKKEQTAVLEKALQEVSKIPRSLEDDPGHSFHNYGSGPQSVHLGHGDQNINTGSGNQFNGKFMGAFHLPK